MYTCMCVFVTSFLSLYRFYFLKHEYVATTTRSLVVSGNKSGNLRPAEKKMWSVYGEAKLKREEKRDEWGWIKESCMRKLQWKESDENNDEKNTSISASALRDAKPFASRVKIIANNRAVAHHARLWHLELPKLLRNTAHEIPKVTISCGVNVNGSRVPSESKQTISLQSRNIAFCRCVEESSTSCKNTHPIRNERLNMRTIDHFMRALSAPMSITDDYDSQIGFLYLLSDPELLFERTVKMK